MEKTRTGLVIVKRENNRNLNLEVALTRKTCKSGRIRYGVVITDRRGIRMRLKSFPAVSSAWGLYRTMREA